MAITGESSSAMSRTENDKPIIVRVKRKASQFSLDAFWLEINERPLKRALFDFEKLSISDSVVIEEPKTKKVLVRHVETVTSSEATIDVLEQFVKTSRDATEGKNKSEERRLTFKKDNRQDQLLSKARQQQKVLAEHARFEQIWRIRKGNKDMMQDKALDEMYRFYDVVRVDVEERSKQTQAQEVTSLEDQRILQSYLPLLREFIPSAAEEIESDIHAHISGQDNYVYDYYTVKEEMNVDSDDASHAFPLVQVEDEDFYDGPDDSEYDSEDSNAEDNPRNDYPEEISEDEEDEEGEEEEEEEEEEEDDKKGEQESEALDESEDGSFGCTYSDYDGLVFEDGMNDDYSDVWYDRDVDDYDGGEGEYW
ncbi:RNA-directed DNA methylation 4 [Carica papaya]|uniref:RNA-directed DNA methylation 4 n=1 Tax=Carica papaya TaxID=3649 RepID=UPI000B8C769A|nr:RNA-directed DNA methylation 4 [Carica papaya]